MKSLQKLYNAIFLHDQSRSCINHHKRSCKHIDTPAFRRPLKICVNLRCRDHRKLSQADQHLVLDILIETVNDDFWGLDHTSFGTAEKLNWPRANTVKGSFTQLAVICASRSIYHSGLVAAVRSVAVSCQSDGTTASKDGPEPTFEASKFRLIDFPEPDIHAERSILICQTAATRDSADLCMCSFSSRRIRSRPPHRPFGSAADITRPAIQLVGKSRSVKNRPLLRVASERTVPRTKLASSVISTRP